MDPLLLVSVLVFFGVLVLSWGVWSYMQSRQKVHDWSIRAKGQSLSQSASQKKEGQPSLKDQGIRLLERFNNLKLGCNGIPGNLCC